MFRFLADKAMFHALNILPESHFSFGLAAKKALPWLVPVGVLPFMIISPEFVREQLPGYKTESKEE